MRTLSSPSAIGVLLSSLLLTACVGEDTVPVEGGDESTSALSGPYLGQTPPGTEPALFASGIVSTGLHEMVVAVSPDGTEIFWSVSTLGYESILFSRMENGRWTDPEVVPFSSRYHDGFPAFHPDGSKLFFHSTRARDGSDTGEDRASIWYVEREGEGWSEARLVPGAVNGERSVCCATATAEGTLYVSKTIEGGEVIARSRLVDGEYTEPEPLPETVNVGRVQFHSTIAPDESYLILPLFGRDEALHDGVNYYVFFRGEDDHWTGPVNLGETVNTPRSGGSPSLTVDGRYFFFSADGERRSWDGFPGEKSLARIQELFAETPSHRTADVYWVSTALIEALRPEG